MNDRLIISADDPKVHQILYNAHRLYSTGQEQNVPKYDGPSYDQVLNIKKTHLTPAIKTHFKKPLLIHRGEMQWLFDYQGRRYLDMFGGIVTVSVGHCHPKVNAELFKQAETLWHTTNIYLHPKIYEYAEKLTAKLPENLNCVYFVNSGSEANDLAMLLARVYTGHYNLISLQNSYHGVSPYTLGLTANSAYKYPLPNVNSGILHTMVPDPYKGLWGGNKCRASPIQVDRKCDCEPESCLAGEQYYQQLVDLFKYSLPIGKCAGMFAESIQGVGGTVQFPKNYIKKSFDLIHENGGLFISDEVQTGFGRTGNNFWGFEDHGIVPDIVTMAKGIGNGFPLAAVITSSQIAETLDKALHFNTFGGSPLACAVGSAVLNVIEEENLQQNSLDVGTYFLNELSKLRNKYEIVGDVRGQGLMIGIELVEDKVSRKPLNSNKFLDIWDKTKDLGVLFGKGGLHGNVIRIKPPMCISKADVDMAIHVLEKSISVHT